MADGSPANPDIDNDVATPTPIRVVKAKAPPLPSQVNGSKPPVPKPSPVTEPAKAVMTERAGLAEIHKGLARDDASRMASARILAGELREVIRDGATFVLSMQGLTIEPAKLDAILDAPTFAGIRVVHGKHGARCVQRKLPRYKALAYAAGGGVESAYSRLAAIQVHWPFVYGLIVTVANVAAMSVETLKACSPSSVKVETVAHHAAEPATAATEAPIANA